MRLLWVPLAALLLPALAAGTLFAEDPPAEPAEPPVRRVVLVLDRGVDAKSDAAAEIHNALRIWKALDARGADAHLMAAGVDEEGETLLLQVPPTRGALEALDTEDATAFTGPTDARAALAWALDTSGERPVDLVLLGPFSEIEKKKKKDAPHAGAVKAWNEKAAQGSRIFALGEGAGRTALETARGWAGDGRLVIGFGAAEVATQPFSPFGRDGARPAPLAATLRVLADVVDLGRGAEGGAVVAIASDVPEDGIEARVTAGLHTWTLRRRVSDGRTATLAFRPVEVEGLHWLGEVPAPLTFRWDALRADARLVGVDGAPPAAFRALDARVGAPVATVYRLQRTLSGRTPAWRAETIVDQGSLEGLEVHVGEELRTSPEVGESEVRVTFTARAGPLFQADGRIVLRADGMPGPLEIPFAVSVERGRARLEVESAAVALPPAAEDPRPRLRIHAENANVPERMPLAATASGPHLAYLSALLQSPTGDVLRWEMVDVLQLPVGVDYRLTFELAPEATRGLAWPCTLTLALVESEGVSTQGTGEIPVRVRRPRLALVAEPVTHRVQDGALRCETPIALRVEADGGDGEWLLGLWQQPPVPRQEGDPPTGWQSVARGQGLWELAPSGEWTGPSPHLFSDRTLELVVQLGWAPGEAPETVRVPVLIPARWGKRGLLLVVLASLALVLAGLVMGWMRTPAVTGTLLYTAQGLEGAVGRLDLKPVGRRAHAITADRQGRLAVAGTGTEIARVRPTRVGGMLEYTEADGSRERRLLVDGLSLRIGRHLLRFVSGRQPQAGDRAALEDVPDLLGPEFDIEGGRIEALGDEPDGA